MLEVRLIGRFDITYGGKSVTISSRVAQSLFAYLILNADTSHRREKLAGMFWPDATEEKARAYLRHELWRIRKALPSKSKSDYLIVDDINISFDASAEYWFDAAGLENVNRGESIKELINALSVFQGELLPGFYDDWIILEREHLQTIYEQKMMRLLELLEGEKRWSEILEWAERWISFGQAPEVAYRALMTAYDALGDRSKVYSTYERCVQALRALDLETSEQTRALAFKRTHSLNIPIPLTSFIGREKELKEVAGLISKSRLVTLTGSGGVGKTRLAIQVVADVLERFPDGVWFLDLAPLNNAELVPSTLANLIGLRESGEVSTNELLIKYFKSRTALVIFDNCEHLIESCAQLVQLLLTSSEHLSILATSREALRVSGEFTYRVPSLKIPKPEVEFSIDELSITESVRLFAERAAVVVPGFAISPQNVLVIAQICQRLDGIPLAIELAAARVNVLTVEQLLTRLDDCFNLLTHGLRSSLPRHQTLRATIEWSYNLLLEKERLLFRRLAVFSGGWTLDAAEEVCGGNGLEAQEILDLLSRLINKSLVLFETTDGSSRYRRLETIRQFARERLIESGELKSMRTRHLKYLVRLAEEAEPALEGPAQMEWNARLHHERDNIRAGLQWADQTDVEAGLILSSSLYLFWYSFDFREGKDWLNRFLQKPESSLYARARADALCMYGAILVDLQQLEELFATAQECLDLYRAVGDQRGEVDGLLLLAAVSSNPIEGSELIKQALHLAQLLGDEQRQVEALWKLGWYDSGQSKFIYWEQAIVLARRIGNWRGLAGGLATAAGFLILNGNFESAEKYLQESERLYRQLNIYPPPAGLLTAYGQLALVHGDLVKARAYFEENARIGLQVGSRQDYLWSRIRLGYVALREGKLAEANSFFNEPAQRFQEDKNEGGVAFTLEGMARLFIALAKPETAARLIGWADATREKINDTRPLIEQAEVDRDIAAITAQIGQVAFSDQYGKGKNMTLDEAVVCAFGGI
jgi:predicted ATPase/DNA-binding SARP family transcriptional activator